VPPRATTHVVDIDPRRGVVSKRFRSWDRDEPSREWLALTLLAEHAPGLAPEPIRAELSADPPFIEMSYLPGTPLDDLPPSAPQAQALARALERLWRAVPSAIIEKSTSRLANPPALIARVRRMLTATRDQGATDLARLAFREGAEWFTRSPPERLGDGETVLGQGDPNLANFLCDGADIRIVDFEDSGASTRAFELAILVEHVSAWSEGGLDAEAFVARFDVTAVERAMLQAFRRLAALFWLLKLQTGNQAHARALHSQAERLLALLG
jgi:Ser/Thr protein kinase RdoA (MazF antagonist)